MTSQPLTITEAFIQACIDGDVPKVKMLLTQDKSLANAFGMVSPAHREFMKKEDADHGWSALHLAAHYGQPEVVTLLVAAGADVNAKATNGIGNTPLMAGVAGNQSDIVQYLLEHGADHRLTDGEGFDAVKLADAEGKPAIAKTIRDFALTHRSCTLRTAMPELPSLDLDASIKYLVDRVGFTLSNRYDGYAILHRGAVEIAYWQCNDEVLPKSSSCYIRVTGIDQLYAELQERGATFRAPLGKQPWGRAEFTLADPGGCNIRMGE